MKKILILLLAFSIFLTGCGASTEELNQQNDELNKRIEEQVKKQMEEMAIQTQNALPTETPIPLPTATETPFMPPHEEPAVQSNPNFILELGYCRNDVNISGNPRDLQGCTIDKTYNVYIDPQTDWGSGGMGIGDRPSQQEFCSLYKPDGTYIMSDIDASDGMLTCHP